MPTPHSTLQRMFAIALLAMMITASAAHADDDDDDDDRGKIPRKTLQSVPGNSKFQQECSSCHIAYAPGLLPAASWRKLMGGLDKHFGSDASLDTADNREISDFLVKNSARRWSTPDAPLRITEAAWFKRKHDAHEINPALWNNPKIKGPANCAACHPQAERGNFDEHDIRIPR